MTDELLENEGFTLAQRRAAQFLASVWRATDPKSYRVAPLKIWGYFENKAVAAAKSSGSLARCLEKLRTAMGAEARADAALVELLAMGEDEADDVLDVLRCEIAAPIALLQLEQSARKEARAKK